MNAPDLFRMAGSNLSRRKGRTTLTLVGVTIGVGALVLLVSLGIGLENQVIKSFEGDEVLRTITVTKPRGKSGAHVRVGAFSPMGQVTPMSEENIREIAALPGVEVAHPDIMMLLSATIPLTVPVDGEKQITADGVPFTGAHEKSLQRLEGAIVRGRPIRPGERACLIPSALVEFRFARKPEEIALEQPLTIPRTEGATETLNFTVVGIVDSDRLGAKRGQIILPLEYALETRDTLKAAYGGFLAYRKDQYPVIEVKVKSAADTKAVKNQIKNLGYEGFSGADFLEMLNTTFLILKAFFACVGAIGLLVAMFGIANTMAMSVLERTREIGIMKALGARARDIRRLFLVEAAWIGLVGGLIGIAGGWGIGLLLDFLAHKLADIPGKAVLFQVTPWLAGGAIGFSVIVSMIAGLIPAIRASRMDPVAALRFE